MQPELEVNSLTLTAARYASDTAVDLLVDPFSVEPIFHSLQKHKSPRKRK